MRPRLKRLRRDTAAASLRLSFRPSIKQRHLNAPCRKPFRGKRSGGSGADDEYIKLLHHHYLERGDLSPLIFRASGQSGDRPTHSLACVVIIRSLAKRGNCRSFVGAAGGRMALFPDPFMSAIYRGSSREARVVVF